jgi:LmbE family N-acetylglucosaminyl deacetylase
VAKKRRVNGKRLLVGTGIAALAGLTLFLWWQPWEFDLVPRSLPERAELAPDPERLFAPGTHVVVVTAHPDDPEFFIGGTLAKLRDAGVVLDLVVVTDGDKAYYPLGDHEETARIRREEQVRAASQWGAREVVFLGFPDGRLAVTEALIEGIVHHLERLSPDYVMAFDGRYPWRLRHQDHRVAGEATQRAVERSRVADWLLLFQTAAPTYGVEITRYWPEKQELLAIHASQFSGTTLDRIISMVEGHARTRGEALGVPYAEDFRVVRLERPDRRGP